MAITDGQSPPSNNSTKGGQKAAETNGSGTAMLNSGEADAVFESDSAVNAGGGEGSSAAFSTSSTDGFYAVYDAKEVIGKPDHDHNNAIIDSRGMSSTVRRCVCRKSGLEYAVKIIDITTEKVTVEEADRLRNDTLSEIALLQILDDSQNIIEMRECFESGTSLYIVFELATGGELFDYLSRLVALSEKKTRQIMRQLLTAVQRLHSKNIVHRDIKPENILMMNEEKIKLTDFGFAKLLREGEKLDELVGTPGYLAPELLKVSMYEDAEGYGLEVDIWACGVIMYTLLAGYAPFFHRRQIYMLRAISEGRYEFRSPEWDEISSEAKDLVSKMLKVDPEERISAANALLHPFISLSMGEDDSQIDGAAPVFNARKRFKCAIRGVLVLVRLKRLPALPLLLPIKSILSQPYSNKKIRRQIDNIAFRVYGHWVKKDREQYRDALFANSPKRDKRRRMSKFEVGPPPVAAATNDS